jgi:hypothetical protein
MQIDIIGRQLEIGDALRTHIGKCRAGAQGARAATVRFAHGATPRSGHVWQACIAEVSGRMDLPRSGIGRRRERMN